MTGSDPESRVLDIVFSTRRVAIISLDEILAYEDTRLR